MTLKRLGRVLPGVEHHAPNARGGSCDYASPLLSVGSTDEIGLRAAERPVHVHDIHASILWLLGLDHVGLTYMHNGRAERPTEVYGSVIRELFA